MTLTQALEETIRLLEEINAPVKYTEEIIRPIWMAVGNIRVCLDAIRRQEQAPQEAPAAQQEKEEEKADV